MFLRGSVLAAGFLTGLGGVLATGSGPATAQQNEYGGLPEGPNRVLVFAICSGCHSVKLVMQQGMTRAKWDETLDWMVDQQGMPRLAPDTESDVLDYLAEHFNTDHRPGGAGGLSPYNSMQPMMPAQ